MNNSKSVPQSPVSGASGHSSENSETQSVSDVSEQPTVSNAGSTRKVENSQFFF